MPDLGHSSLLRLVRRKLELARQHLHSMAHRQEEPSKDVKAMEGTFSLSIAKSDFKFNAAHFMVFGDGTRERLHGHNYQVSVSVRVWQAPGAASLLRKGLTHRYATAWYS